MKGRSVLEFLWRREQGSALRLQERFLRDRWRNAGEIYKKDLLAHYGCVNALEFSQDGDLMVSGGDDRRVLLWNVDRAPCQTAATNPPV